MLPSPCINLCKMHPTVGLCQGCYRTLEEIGRWSRTEDTERAKILEAIVERRRQFPDLLTHR